MISNQNIEKAKETFSKQMILEGYDINYIKSQIGFLFDANTVGYEGRLKFFVPYIKNIAKKSILVSGSAVGYELLVAKKMGFKKVVGTEVSDLYVKTAEILTKGYGVETIMYDGFVLPYKNNTFDVLQSCHIIEHTKDPESYIKEHIRVLKKKSLFFIEYPDRNYKTELHTNTISFERYPRKIRNSILTALSRCPYIEESKREKYRLVRDTLQQISKKDIEQILNKLDIDYDLLNEIIAAPGIVRLLYKVKI